MSRAQRLTRGGLQRGVFLTCAFCCSAALLAELVVAHWFNALLALAGLAASSAAFLWDSTP